jgi:UDP-3-O-[3-hydroxymyristoyl] N-acetylglucosamine deacetylase
MMYQKTIKNETTFEGVGLHTGKVCKVTLKPAQSNTGIIFFRIDRGNMIKLSPFAVVDTSFATTIGYNGTRVKTIEHLMAVLSAFEIDNLFIDVDGPEIPALPYSGRRFSQTIEFSNHFLGKQQISVELTPEVFVNDIAPARTFGFLKDVEMLRQHGLGRGGSLDNAVVIDDNGVLNPSGTRFPDEFVRHKALDCIGDMYLCGYQIHGHIIAERTGHTTNVKFLKKLFESRDCFRTYQFEADSTSPQYITAPLFEQNVI